MNSDDNTASLPDVIAGIIKEIDTCQKAGAVTAAIMLTYVGIDALAYLSAPQGQASQTKADFINWVDKHLKVNPQQIYQYDGKKVYGARCAMIHTYSIEAAYHQKNSGVKQFGCHDGGRHYHGLTIMANLVMIGAASLVDDFQNAVMNFLDNLQTDTDMRTWVWGDCRNSSRSFHDQKKHEDNDGKYLLS